jgi:hypothetical protein
VKIFPGPLIMVIKILDMAPAAKYSCTWFGRAQFAAYLNISDEVLP